jgi:hypothetical protein
MTNLELKKENLKLRNLISDIWKEAILAKNFKSNNQEIIDMIETHINLESS